jgi:hypothetical protein
MIIEILTFIEVNNIQHEWAVKLSECKYEMNPDVVRYAMLHNDLSNKDIIYVDYTLSYIKPEKIIDGVNGGIAEDFIQVGCWRIKK